MRIFLSHASEDREVAEEVQLALTGAGHTVFYDVSSLRAGSEYHERIQNEVQQSDLFVFLISPHSVAPGRYTLTELRYARDRWPHPKDRVIPVLIAPTDRKSVPAYLKAVKILEPAGNVAADLVDAVEQLQGAGAPAEASPPAAAVSGTFVRRFLIGFFAVVAILGLATVLAILAIPGRRPEQPKQPETPPARIVIPPFPSDSHLPPRTAREDPAKVVHFSKPGKPTRVYRGGHAMEWRLVVTATNDGSEMHAGSVNATFFGPWGEPRLGRGSLPALEPGRKAQVEIITLEDVGGTTDVKVTWAGGW